MGKAALSDVTAADYARAYLKACALEYPVMDRLEEKYPFPINRTRLQRAARILACPLKDHPPHWQHGRMIYAVTRAYLSGRFEPIALLDIGTAKGFSALCLQWALNDSDARDWGAVVSVDVLDPMGTERRNSVLEVDGPKTLAQFLELWPESRRIRFIKSPGLAYLKKHPGRINVAFVDGKHKGEATYEGKKGQVVWAEGEALFAHQELDDLVMFDDVQMDSVGLAVKQLEKLYDMEYVKCCEYRTYAIGVRR